MQRKVPIAGLAMTLLLAGCHTSSSGTAREAGSDLPVTSSDSVALPAATNAADAPRAPQVAESRTATLTTYRDPATGVSFNYPSVWRPAIAGQSPAAPAFEQVAGKAKMTQQFLPERTYYAGTVLRALSFSYKVKNGSNAGECASLAKKALPSAGKPVQMSYNGLQYTEAAGSDAGACTHVQTQVDTTLRGSQCFLFERDFVTSCPYVTTPTTPRPLTQGETVALQRHLDAIMQSVQIASR